MTMQTWLTAEADRRRRLGLTRTLVTRAADAGNIDLAGNDYLGLCRDRRVTKAAAAAAQLWGAGAGASRLVTGTLALHTELESSLADFVGHEAALVHSTGYHANLSVVTALSGKDSLVVSDAHVHASLVDACRLSRATVSVVPHNDLAAVERHLAERGQDRALVLVESIYSVLGDAAPLVALAGLCERYDATLVVDEAHGIGVAGGGRGLVHELGLHSRPSVVVTMTLSKALGSQGGAVLGSAAVIDHLVNRSRPFIFDTGLAPPAAAAALTALEIVVREPGRVGRLARAAEMLAAASGTVRTAGAVLSIPMAGPQEALDAQAECALMGVLVGCFRPPSVPDGISRLRVTASAGLDDSSLERACTVVASVTG